MDDFQDAPDSGSAGASTSTGEGGSGGHGGTGTGVGGAGATGAGGEHGGSGGVGPCGFNSECAVVPADWNGPVVVGESNTGTPLDCPDGAPPSTVLHRALTATGGCDPCSCSASCSIADLQWWSGAGCTGSPTNYPQTDGICYSNLPDYSISVSVAAPTTSCQASGGQDNFDLPQWTWAASVCDGVPVAGECTEGACVATSPADFLPGICVWREGNHDCPAGFALRRTYYPEDAVTDTRSCTACGCTVSQACQTRTALWFNSGCCCANQLYVYHPAGCTDVQTRHSHRSTVYGQPSCGVSQDATVVGQATADSDAIVTVCCGSGA